MTTYRCPEGHESTSADYCDTCGAPIDAAAAPAAAAAAPPAPSPAGSAALAGESKVCPHCSEPNPEAALFCESCGYDFTTGQVPPGSSTPPPPSAPAPAAAPAAPPSGLSLDSPVPVSWVAEVWVDPAWYERNREETTDPCPAAGEPKVAPLVGSGTQLIGRPSASRNVHPQVDCTPDTGVSRRHAQLIIDNGRWYVEDLGSTNGTYAAGANAALPAAPIPSGQRRELGENDRIFVGTWTRIVVRRATATEAGH
jgi:hypothetical protein